MLYPDVDAIGRQLPGPLNQCWRFFDPTTYFRDNSDAAAITAMTRTVMSKRNIDGESVYMVGASAGGLLISASAAPIPTSTRIIHDMPHAWPGGTTDPTVKGYGDRKAPDGAEATWSFLVRYRKAGSGMPCAERG